MARYRKIDTRTWNDKKFNELSDSAKLVFFLLLTHPHMTSIGAMRASLQSLAGDLHWPLEKIEHAFQEILQKNIIGCHPLAELRSIEKRAPLRNFYNFA